MAELEPITAVKMWEPDNHSLSNSHLQPSQLSQICSCVLQENMRRWYLDESKLIQLDVSPSSVRNVCLSTSVDFPLVRTELWGQCRMCSVFHFCLIFLLPRLPGAVAAWCIYTCLQYLQYRNTASLVFSLLVLTGIVGLGLGDISNASIEVTQHADTAKCLLDPL